ncbi:hypothetical protein C2S52_012225 [Perilla frutescens var. hirtella]|nr:hypothetical protein C2S52_012225 [Perilla frutescens var. hirtella]
MGAKGSGKGVMVSRRSDLAVLRTIHANLDQANFEKIKGSCFGHLFLQPEFNCQGQLHAILLSKLQRHSVSRKQLSFKINGDIIEFGPKEFAVLTGLMLTGDAETPSTSAFHHEVFKNKNSLYFVDIEKKLEAVHNSGQGGSETSYKLALLLLVYGILLANDRISKAFTLAYLHVIDDEHQFNIFPWGKAWLYELMPSIADQYAVSVEGTSNTFPRMLRWCVPKTMTTVYDEVRPFFSRKSSEAKRMLQTSEAEEQILHDLGVAEYEESIEPLMDALDDCVSSNDGLDCSDNELSEDGDNEKGKRKIDGTLPSPSNRPGKRTRQWYSVEATDHNLARLCTNSDSDLHELVKGKRGVAEPDMVGTGVELLHVDEDGKHAGESSAQAESNRKHSASLLSGEKVKTKGKSSAESKRGDEVVMDDEEASGQSAEEDSDAPTSQSGGEEALNDYAYTSSQQADEAEDVNNDGESTAQTEAEASDESSSHLDGKEEALVSSGASGADREEKGDVVKDAVGSSDTSRAVGDDLRSQPVENNDDDN